ncbi:MAG: metallophosphoesterase [Saprospiraceae bacterium]|nr:metallophosphoesterase [Saprospiraceae bacterium]
MEKPGFFRYFLAAFIAATTAAAQTPAPGAGIFDGPYLFWEQDTLIARWIADGELLEERLQKGKSLNLGAGVSSTFDADCIDFDDAAFKLSPVSAFKDVAQIAVIADPHGQLGIMRQLLLAHDIMDEQQNWTFGNGHLVILGDVFDRGEQVTDIFWLILKLEKQAALAGGMVHFLWGNHELMVLENDLRYIHKKYRYTMARMGRSLPQLFGPDTYLGRWLRSKPVVISINGIVFVHAGFSDQLLQMKLSMAEINAAFQERVIDRLEADISADPLASLLSSELGPVWYRGFFAEQYDAEDMRYMLSRLKAKRVVVGHTSFPEITALYGRKIIAADSSIKTGETGEMLFITKKQLLRGKLNGERVVLR